jgi:hypothetical protein
MRRCDMKLNQEEIGLVLKLAEISLDYLREYEKDYSSGPSTQQLICDIEKLMVNCLIEIK